MNHKAGAVEQDRKITVVNFSHPVTDHQLEQLAALLSVDTDGISVKDVAVHFDHAGSFAAQAVAVVDEVDLGWQTDSYVVVPPGHSTAAACLLAEINGRSGAFPTVVRVAPDSSRPNSYRVEELIDLRSLRTEARTRRANR